jgi:RNA polymerase sigma-70 factor (ECF subfamily)
MPPQDLASRNAAFAADDALVARALAGDGRAFRAIMQKYNQRLYRIARGILRHDADAEDAVQEAYLKAFAHLAGFRGEASFATWLTRIAMNEALLRLRKQRATVPLEPPGPRAAIIPFPLAAADADPERTMAQRQILHLIERATDELPEAYRTVFIMRVIEGLSVEDTAQLLDLRPETVKTRLHRARRLIREQLDRQIGPVLADAFPFAGRRCERLTEAVMARLGGGR